MNFLVLSALFLFGALAAAEPRPHVLRAMGADEIFGLTKRQGGGYQPTTYTCSGTGTCAQACGPTFQLCGSACYDTTTQFCCSDGNNACEDGYYCTQDSAGNPWCCPDGEDLASCAAQYGVTSLSSVAASTSSSTSSSASWSTSSSASWSTSSATSSSWATTTTSSWSYTTSTYSTTTYSQNTTVISATISATIQGYTGAANPRAVGGFALPLVLAGAVAVL